MKCDLANFRKLTKQLNETHEIPDLEAKEVLFDWSKDKDKDKIKASFVKDMIAFGNWSRRTGEPSHIIFGVGERQREEGPSEFVFTGLHQDPARPRVRLQEDLDRAWQDAIKGYLSEPIRIELTLGELDSGVDDFHTESRMWAILAIYPTLTRRPIRVEKKLDTLRPGQVFLRQGSQSLLVPDEHVELLCARSQVAYLTEQDWRYLIGEQSPPASLSFPLIRLPARESDGNDALSDLKRQIAESNGHICLIGPGGIGKTTLMEAIAANLAQEALDAHWNGPSIYAGSVLTDRQGAAIDFNSSKLEVTPPSAIPVLVRMQAQFDSLLVFEGYIRDCLVPKTNAYLQQDDTIDQLLSIPGTHWLFLLDGVDEARPRDRIESILSTWLEKVKSRYGDRVRCVWSTREAVLRRQNPQVVSLQPPSWNEVEDWLRKRAEDMLADKPENTSWALTQLERLTAHRHFQELLVVPRWMSAFVSTWLPESVPLSGLEAASFGVANLTAAPRLTVEPITNEDEARSDLPRLNVDPDDSSDIEQVPVDNDTRADEHDEDAPELKIAQVVSNIIDLVLTAEAERQIDSDNSPTRHRLAMRLLAIGVRDWDQRGFRWDEALREYSYSDKEVFDRRWSELGILSPLPGVRSASWRHRFVHVLTHEVLVSEHWADGHPEYRLLEWLDHSNAPVDANERIRGYFQELTPLFASG